MIIICKMCDMRFDTIHKLNDNVAKQHSLQNLNDIEIPEGTVIASHEIDTIE